MRLICVDDTFPINSQVTATAKRLLIFSRPLIAIPALRKLIRGWRIRTFSWLSLMFFLQRMLI
jgi:hypothetical protein